MELFGPSQEQQRLHHQVYFNTAKALLVAGRVLGLTQAQMERLEALNNEASRILDKESAARIGDWLHTQVADLETRAASLESAVDEAIEAFEQRNVDDAMDCVSVIFEAVTSLEELVESAPSLAIELPTEHIDTLRALGSVAGYDWRRD